MPADLTDWTSLVASLWQRVRRRGWALGSEWPRQSMIFDSGLITSADAAASTITDGSKVWPLDFWRGEGVELGPEFFDLVVDLAGSNNAPQWLIHFTIFGNTATALKVSPLDCDPVVSGHVTSWSQLAGKRYWIIDANSPSRGLWWSERIPQWPRARSRWRGEIKSIAASSDDATKLTLTMRDASWTAGKWTESDLIYFDTGNQQRRVTITQSTPSTLKITTDHWPRLNSDVHVVAHGGLWHNAGDERIFTWHQSPIGGNFGEPSGTVTVYDYDFLADHVVDIIVPCFDKEVWGEFDLPQVAAPDRCYTPNWLKTFRGLQVTLEDFAPSFVPVADYNGATSIPNYTRDTLMAAAGLPATGWRRYLPREFRYAYDRTFWMPDDPEHPLIAEDELNGDGTVKTQRTGTYLTRPKSTHNSEYGYTGLRADAFTPASDGPDSLADGQIARYIADNHGDGFDKDNYGRFFTATPPPPNQPHGEAGRVTSAATLYLIDKDKHWAGGDLIVHSGTASSGGTTTLTDATKVNSSFWTHPDRGRWAGHWVEVQAGNDDQGNPIWEQRPITSHSGTSIGWDMPLTAAAGGSPYRIREPGGELNRWRDRYVRVADASGNNYRAKIAYSSDNCLWFGSALPTAPQAGWSYSIEELLIGGTYKRVSGEWVAATGTDSRPNRHGVKFPSQPTAIVPDVLARNGRFLKGDYVGQWLIDDLTTVINLLQWTKTGFTWTSRATPGVAENNFKDANGRGFGSSFVASWSEQWSQVLAGLNTPHTEQGGFYDYGYIAYEANGASPSGFSTASKDATPGTSDDETGAQALAGMTKGYAYPTMGNPSPRLGSTVDFFVFAVGPTGAPFDGTSGTTDYPYIGVRSKVAFDDFGDPVKDHAFSLVGSKGISPSDPDPIIGPKVGSASTLPAQEPPDTTGFFWIDQGDPLNPNPGGCWPGRIYFSGNGAGYSLTAWTGIIKWAMN